MKKFNKKSIVLLACVTLLLTFTVSGTVAFLADNDGPVTNTFTPTKVEITVTDEVKEGAKQNVVIHNHSTIPVYIRVAVVANWVKDGQIVAPWNDYSSLPIASGWTKLDGFYYYGPTSDATINFFKPNEPYKATAPVEGAHLEMDIIVQAIQSQPVNAVTEAWGRTPPASAQ